MRQSENPGSSWVPGPGYRTAVNYLWHPSWSGLWLKLWAKATAALSWRYSEGVEAWKGLWNPFLFSTYSHYSPSNLNPSRLKGNKVSHTFPSRRSWTNRLTQLNDLGSSKEKEHSSQSRSRKEENQKKPSNNSQRKIMYRSKENNVSHPFLHLKLEKSKPVKP